METQVIIPAQIWEQKPQLDACALLEQCPDMEGVLKQVRQFAPSDATVLLTGGTGTGKEVVARAIHKLSSRREKEWVVVDCTAIPETLAESTLFGHEHGAFTGAAGQHKGLFEQAHRSTAFLDEVGKLPLGVQAKFLRVLESKSFRRVGGAGEVRSDFRSVVATNCDLWKMVGEEKFLEDLYYRLNVVIIDIPPLRARSRDVVPLAEHFVSVFADGRNITLADKSRSVLAAHHWPGNVRELKHVIERAMVLVNGEGVIQPQHLRLEVREVIFEDLSADEPLVKVAELADHQPFWEVVESVERAIIVRALGRCAGNAVKAAEQLKLPRRTLNHKTQQLKIKIAAV